MPRMEERAIEPQEKEEDKIIEGSLRPKSLQEFVGQRDLKDSLSIMMQAAQARK